MFTPLVRPNSTFNMQPVENQVANTNTNANTESLNNSTATFQEINKSDNTSSNAQFAKAIAEASKSSDSGAKRSEDKENDGKALSDERCKELFGNDCDLIGAIADLNEYVYKYKKGADKIDPKATPDEVHVGPIAQELKANPVTEAAVEEDPLTGFLKVDTAQLSLAEMSILSAMAKRIEAIEKKLSERP